MRNTAYLLIVAVLLLGAPAFAQGPFNDVPTDHWAYDAVNKLQKDGIVIGYPDGTFGGKRAMSRYEFATAIARLLPLINPDLSAYATKEELRQAIANIKVPDIDLSQYATKADLDALKKLIDEFRDTLAALGVDVDALKRDVAALAARVDALEAEVKRVRWTGDLNVFGISTSTQEGEPFDLDERSTIGSDNEGSQDVPGLKDTLMRNIVVVRDFDLNVVGRVSATTTANATINYGNYLQYLAFIDDYADGFRPYDKEGFEDPAEGADVETDIADQFFPYYMYINQGLCKGNLQVGRLPIQFTPYTLKKIDVDSYTTILKTDDGNYPIDGAKLTYNFGGVDLTLFACRNDLNSMLQNGLTGHPFAGLYSGNNDGFNFMTDGALLDSGPVGGLLDVITQTAGGRLTVGTPWKGLLGVTYYQAWSEEAWADEHDFDQARVFGADLTIPFGNWGIAASWTRSDTLARDGAVGVDDLDEDNTAWDAAINGAFGKLGVAAGYKRIERNFTAAGAWDKIGRWTNPSNIQGPYLNLSLPIARKLRVALNGEFLSMIDDVREFGNVGWGADDDTIIKAEAGLQWGISAMNSLDLGYQWIRFSPDSDAVDDATETYLTVGWAHQFSPNAGMKIGYQFINYDDGALQIPAVGGPAIPRSNGPYVGDYRGGLGVIQFGVSF